MGVERIYKTSEIAALLDNFEDKYLKQLRTVRSDITNEEFNFKKNRGTDTAHAQRSHLLGHNADAKFAKKSKWADRTAMINGTTEVLNSTEGQQQLAELDKNDPGGAGNVQERIVAKVAGELYGEREGVKIKVVDAEVDVYKIGRDVLWIHTSYPLL
ncbi:MAG: hypothetical protein MUP90_07065 [Gammaproteobacteria bacterium]|nr:hypothetical protein [Gammaproteobacteria bacterium]